MKTSLRAVPDSILFFHLAHYPSDPDDIAFVLCAENGHATHLISYDHHLLVLQGSYSFKICKTVDFLSELRQALASASASCDRRHCCNGRRN